MPTTFAIIRNLQNLFHKSWRQGKERDQRARITSAVMLAFRFLQMGLALLLMRMMISEHGSESYGIWILITGIAAFSASADLGIGNSVVNFISYAFSADDWRSMGNILIHAAAALIGITAFLFCAGAIVSAYTEFPESFFTNQPTEKQANLSFATLCFVAGLLLSIPLSIVEKFLNGIQQGGIALLWTGGATIISTTTLIILILSGVEVSTLVIVHAFVPLSILTVMSIHVIVHNRKLLFPEKISFDKKLTSKLIRDGFWFCLLQLAVGFRVMSDNFVVGYALGAAAVADLSVPGKLFIVGGAIVAAMSAPLWAAYAEALASKDIHWITNSLRRMTKRIICVLMIFSVCILIFGEWLCLFLSDGKTGASYSLLVLMCVCCLLSCLINLQANYLSARRFMNIQFLYVLPANIINVLLSLYLVKSIGVKGAILATVIVEIPLLLIPFYFVIKRDLKQMSAGHDYLILQ